MSEARETCAPEGSWSEKAGARSPAASVVVDSDAGGGVVPPVAPYVEHPAIPSTEESAS